MEVISDSKLAVIEVTEKGYEQGKKKSSDCVLLNDRQIQILKNKLPKERISRFNILINLDIVFDFNRTKLATFLAEQGLVGYSRSNLFKILGPPAFEHQTYKKLEEALARINEQTLFALITTKTVRMRLSSMSVGSRDPTKIKKK